MLCVILILIRYLETRDNAVLKKYKSVRNKIKNEICKLQKEEQ